MTADLFLTLFAFALIVAFFGTAAWAGVRAAPWLPTRTNDIRRLLDLAQLKEGEALFDLGCGDGRVLSIAAYEYNARAIGFEISLLPYLIAVIRRIAHQNRQRIRVVYRDFFSASLRDADVVYCFLTPSAMKKLKTKFVQELKPGARVVSYAFSLGELPGAEQHKPNAGAPAAYLYRVPERVLEH
jgi:SAM-dependent methyltransferase